MSDLERLVQRARQLRRWETSSFPTGAGGTVHYPAPSLRGGKPVTAGIGGEIIIGSQPCGQLIDLSTSTAHLGPGGEPIVWDAIGTQHVGWSDAVVPAAQFAAPCDAVYGIELNIRQPESTVGGDVWIYVNGAAFKQFGGYQEAWTRFEGTEEIIVNAGDLISIVVDHSGSSDLEFTGTLTIGGKERTTDAVTTPVEFGGFKHGESGGNTGSVARPDDTAAGDLLVAMAGQRNDVGLGAVTTGLTIAGFTQIQLQTGTGDDSVALVVATKVAGGSEPSSYSWTLSGAGSAGSEVVMMRITGGGLVAQSGKTIGNQPLALPDVGDIAGGQLIVGVTGKYDETPNSALPTDTTLVKQSSGAVGLVNRCVTWWWSGTPGTSVRTVSTDGTVETLGIVVRVSA